MLDILSPVIQEAEAQLPQDIIETILMQLISRKKVNLCFYLFNLCIIQIHATITTICMN